MKYSIRKTAALLLCFCVCLSGCDALQAEPEAATYFHIDSEREYRTSVSAVPSVESVYAGQYAVIPKEEPVSSYVSTKLCVNNTTNQALSWENPFETIYPASITKIMTALLVLEQGNLEDTVTITEDIVLNDPLAVALGLTVGDTISVRELMYGMLVASANDCAVALGRYIAGTEEAFVGQMNRRAAELGATHTHFVNTNGLHAEDHYTTGYDLYLIFKELLTHEEFRQISGTADYTLHYTHGDGELAEVSIQNSNLFVTGGYSLPEGMTVLCGKTGTTNEAGCCLIVEARDGQGQDYIAVICGAGSRAYLYTQMQQMLNQTQVTEASP